MSTFRILTHLISTTAYEVGSVIILMLEMRKLRPREAREGSKVTQQAGGRGRT